MKKKGGNKIVLKRCKVQGGNQWVWVSAVNWKREFQSELVCGGEKEITPAKSKIHSFISHQDPLIGRVHCVSIPSLDVGESTEAFFCSVISAFLPVTGSPDFIFSTEKEIIFDSFQN